MTQEKQKVIRVLQPNKKAQKPKPNFLIGISALVIGILVITGLLFAFLKKNPEQSLPQKVNQNIDDKDVGLIAKHNSTDEKSEDLKQIDSEDQADKANDDIQHPQPKLNEITNIFKHNKQTQTTVIEKKSASGNPFDHIINAEKSNTTQLVGQSKNPLIKVTPTQAVPAEKINITNANDPKVQKPSIKATESKSIENKKIEEKGPDASVKIQVTKSAKDATLVKQSTSTKQTETLKDTTREKE